MKDPTNKWMIIYEKVDVYFLHIHEWKCLTRVLGARVAASAAAGGEEEGVVVASGGATFMGGGSIDPGGKEFFAYIYKTKMGKYCKN